MWITKFFNVLFLQLKWSVSFCAVLQMYITPNENWNNFKCHLKIRETSIEELGKLEKY